MPFIYVVHLKTILAVILFSTRNVLLSAQMGERLGSGIFTAAVKRGVVPHTRKQRVLAAISKLRSAFFTGYKNKICTYYNIIYRIAGIFSE